MDRRAARGHPCGTYDLAVLDLGLPGLGGEDVLERLRRSGGMPVIVLTGRSEEGERVKVLDLGADDYASSSRARCTSSEARIRAVLRRRSGDPDFQGGSRVGRLSASIGPSTQRRVGWGSPRPGHRRSSTFLRFWLRPRTRSAAAAGAARTCLGIDPRLAGPRRLSPSTRQAAASEARIRSGVASLVTDGSAVSVIASRMQRRLTASRRTHSARRKAGSADGPGTIDSEIASPLHAEVQPAPLQLRLTPLIPGIRELMQHSLTSRADAPGALPGKRGLKRRRVGQNGDVDDGVPWLLVIDIVPPS